MSSSDEIDGCSPAPKKYKSWKDDENKMIPLRTLNRYQSKSVSYQLESLAVDVENVCKSRRQDMLDTNCVIQLTSESSSSEDSDNESIIDECDCNASNGEINEFNGAESFDGSDSNNSENNFNDNVELADENDINVNFSNNIDCNLVQMNQELDLVLESNNSMTIDEDMVALLDLYVNHKWTEASLTSVLQLLHKMIPENNLPRSVYRLFNYVGNLVPSFDTIKHFYGKQCLVYNDIDPKIQKCCQCDSDNISFFFKIDICQQMKFMFEHQNLAEKLIQFSTTRNKDIISDILDGSEYQRVNKRVDRHMYDLTIMFNTDGLSLVKSAKSHCWPLAFTIIELPDYLRETHLTIIGLWYDKDFKPNMNLCLKPFCLKLKKCFDKDITWKDPKTGQQITSRIVAPLIIADAPARAEIQNIQNFNGKYGCNVCKLKMKK